MIQGFGSRLLSFIGASLLVAASGASWSQADSGQQAREQQTITPNFKDADITQVIEAVSTVTGKTIIPDPRVRANVTILSSTPMKPDAFYQAFLSILQVHGFVAVPAGNIIKIIPDATARQVPANDLPEKVSSSSDEFVTQVIDVKNVSAAQLVPILRPLVSTTAGHMVAYPQSNILVISDRANNVNRMMRIIRRIDQQSDSDFEVVPLQNASAAEIVRVTTSLYAQQAGAEGGSALKIVADDRSNSIIISGEPTARLRAKTLVTYLDTPLQSGGDTQVRYLHYAVAEDMAKSLKEQVQGIVQSSGQPGATGPAAAQQAGRDVMISADKYNNALLITAPPKVMKSINALIDKLDIRRAQVLVEAIIVEVSADKSAELGVNWIVGPADPETGKTIPIGIFNQPVGGTTIGQMAAAALGLEGNSTRTTTTAPDGTITVNETRDTAAISQVANALPAGATIGGGRIGDSGTNFIALLRAIRGDSTSNIVSMPQTVTLDNQEAELKVAQEVPFLTGSYANTGGGTATGATGAVNPFQTIQRQEVGTILKVTPQINEGNAVRLKLNIESSSLAQSSQGAVDLITNKRTISTNVLVEDGGIVVLGGLMSDQSLRGEQRVPFLGRIPIVGLAFKTRNARAGKTTLMVFIQPKILRDGVQTAIETNSKYNYIREEQRKTDKRELLPLLPGTKKPQLPPLPEPSTAAPAATAPEEKAPETEKTTNKSDSPQSTTPPEQQQTPQQ